MDPFCGSGTFPIEAAMMAANIAPGMNRDFTAQVWENLIEKKTWYEAFEEARDLVDTSAEVDIQGYDIDEQVIRLARENAKRAGVEHMIHFQRRSVSDLRHPKKYGFVITNPPYGERMEDKENLPDLYRQIGEAYRGLDAWSMYIITGYEDAERFLSIYGTEASQKKKIISYSSAFNVINLTTSLTILRLAGRICLAAHALCRLEQHCGELIANSD